MKSESKPVISYAQNAEDIVLMRGLSHIARGYYVDVGAAHPVEDNVTKLFYERGWAGINVEPDPNHFELLKKDRPRDINLNIGAGDREDELCFFRFPGTGFSTFDAGIAAARKQDGTACEESRRRIRRLDAIIGETRLVDIHFLKIDVEGFERQVLEGLDFSHWRPWILVIEATNPGSNSLAAESWEKLVTEAGYRRCLFDGVNLFFCAEEHAAEIAERISYPANAVDNFVRRDFAHYKQSYERQTKILDAWTRALETTHRKLPLPEVARPQVARQERHRTPTLFVDVTCLRDKDFVTGIQRVTLNVAACLKRISDKGGLPIVFTAYENNAYRNVSFELADGTPPTAFFGAPGESIRLLPGDEWLSCELNYDDIIHHFDWYRRVKDAGVGLNFWVYDLFPLMRPDWSTQDEVLKFTIWFELVSALATRIICDSAKVMRDVENWISAYPSPRAKPGERPDIFPLHLGADGMENVKISNPRKVVYPRLDLEIPRKKSEATFVAVSTIHPRKALDLMVRGFELLWKEGREIDLLLTGLPMMENSLTAWLLQHPHYNRNIFFSGYVQDSDIRDIFRRCDALVFPSYDEGFGLPVVEAAWQGLTAIVRDRPVLRELGGDDLFYFEDGGPDAFAAGVERFLSLPKENRPKALPREKLLRWEDVTMRLLDVMELSGFIQAKEIAPRE